MAQDDWRNHPSLKVRPLVVELLVAKGRKFGRKREREEQMRLRLEQLRGPKASPEEQPQQSQEDPNDPFLL